LASIYNSAEGAALPNSAIWRGGGRRGAQGLLLRV